MSDSLKAGTAVVVAVLIAAILFLVITAIDPNPDSRMPPAGAGGMLNGFLTEAEALARPGTVDVNGTHTTQYKTSSAAGKTYDMRDFVSTAYHQGETSYPLSFKGAPDTYIVGPTVQGTNDPNLTWQEWESIYDGSGGGAMWLETVGRSGVYGFRAFNVFDFFKPRPTNAGDRNARILLAHSYAKDVHDDCIENDYEMHVVVRDVVCNGVHMGISIAQDSGTSGVVTKVVNSTIIFKPYGNDKAADGEGHADLFKQVGDGTIFMKNFNACYSENPLESSKLQNWPSGTYENVKMVLGPDFTFPLSMFGDVPTGVTFSRDWSICTRAVSSWLNRNGPEALQDAMIAQATVIHAATSPIRASPGSSDSSGASELP